MKATDAMLADHKMIRKLTSEMRLDNPRFAQIAESAHRILTGHAWFESRIFFPAVEKSPMLARRFTDDLYREHDDIDALIDLVRDPATDPAHLDGYLRQFRSMVDTHFAKEEDVFFPLTERILDSEGLNRLGEEMRLRQAESRAAFDQRPR